MGSSKLVVDSVHGDIQPSDLEWKVIDTASFQRLRKLKQLQMAYQVYPNATHTRFAHSVGVLHVMTRILKAVGQEIEEEDKEALRLAALMHDIGHYPYSHLLEGVDRVILTEEHLSSTKKTLTTDHLPYPSHEDVGHAILTSQSDLGEVLGARTQRVANLFSGKEISAQQLGKLLHSSLDMDRLDYLIRDSQATGVPYGTVDIHYLLNNIRRAADGSIGISHKAIAAAEHLLLARSFLFRVVCQHKTVFGLEEAARQLLRRLRNRAQDQGNHYGVPKDGGEILEIARSNRLLAFTDSFLDQIFVQASQDSDPIVHNLARTLISRRPPILIWQHKTFAPSNELLEVGELFKEKCKSELAPLAKKYGFDPASFLICELKPIGFEARGSTISRNEWRKVEEAGEAEEMIKVFPDSSSDKLVDIVEIPHSILHKIGDHVYRTYRLYLVHPGELDSSSIKSIKEAAAEALKRVKGLAPDGA